MKKHYWIRLIVPAVLLVFVVSTVQAEEPDDIPTHIRHPNALGIQGGEISGIGLSYHRWMGDIGIQITGGAMYVPFDEDEFLYYSWSNKVLDYNLGFELQRSLYARDLDKHPLYWQLYLAAGAIHRGYIDYSSEWIRDEEADENDYYSGTTVYTINPYVPVLGLGFGIGVELILFDHLSVPIEFLYGAFWEGRDIDLAKQFRIEAVPQIGLRYRY